MRQNSAKSKLKSGKPIFGTFLSYPSPDIVEICGKLGFDFVIIDAEHQPLDEGSASEIIRAADACQIPAIVRVADNAAHTITRFLDLGAVGIQVPNVESKADASRAVMSTKYPPVGKRGFGLARAFDYGVGPSRVDYIDQANRETMIVLQIESPQGVASLPDILAVEQVDVVFIGPVDLAMAMGYGGDSDHAEVQEAIARTIETTIAFGRAPGIYAPSPEQARNYAEMGVTYLATGLSPMLVSGIRRFLSVARGA